MCRHVANLLAVVWVVGVGVGLLAQEAPKTPAVAATKGSQGTFSIGGGTYKLAHAVAYEAKVFDDFIIHVLASSEPIAVEKLKTALREGKGSNDKFITFQPQVMLTFNKKSGEVSFCNANAKGNSISVLGGGLSGELAVKDGRVVGKAALKNDKGDDRGSFDLQFDLELIAAVVVPDDKPTKREKPKGTTKGKDETVAEDSKPTQGKATADSVPDPFRACNTDGTERRCGRVARQIVSYRASSLLMERVVVPTRHLGEEPVLPSWRKVFTH